MGMTELFVNLLSILGLVVPLSSVVLVYIIWKRSEVIEIDSGGNERCILS
jgi:hypothetical protein